MRIGNSETLSAKWNKIFSEGRNYRDLNEAHILDLLDAFSCANGFRPNAVVDLGCGNGTTLVHFSELDIPSFGVDFSEVALEQARQRISLQKYFVKFYHHDLNAFETFDVDFPVGTLWIMKFVIAFIEDKKGFLDVMKRRMNSGDVFLILTPVLRDDLVYTKKDKPHIAVKASAMEMLLKDVFDSFDVFSNEYMDERTRVVGYLVKK